VIVSAPAANAGDVFAFAEVMCFRPQCPRPPVCERFCERERQTSLPVRCRGGVLRLCFPWSEPLRAAIGLVGLARFELATP
jgi:hypothetical protein